MSRYYDRAAGEMLGPYQVVRPLGSGVEGHVLLVRDMRVTGDSGDTGLRTFKLLRGQDQGPQTLHTAKFWQRYVGIAQVKQVIECGYISRQRGVGRRWYIVGTYTAGKTLAESAEEPGLDVVGLLIRVCEALVPIHAAGHGIGDFDCGRNLVVEDGTGSVVFVDLDAGTPDEAAPHPSEDMHELMLLVRLMYHCQRVQAPGDIQDLLSASPTPRSLLDELRSMSGGG